MNEPPKTIRLIWKSIVRRPFRSVATIVCFALIAGSILSSSILMGSAEMSVNIGRDRMGADLAVVPSGYENLSAGGGTSGMGMGGGGSATSTGELALLMVEPYGLYFNGTELEQVRGLPGVTEASPQAYVPAPLLLISRLVGFDPESDFVVQSWVQGGEARPLHNGEAILGSSVAINNATTLSIYGRQFNITERLDRTGTVMDTSMFIRLDDLYSLSSTESTPGTPTLTLEEGQVSAIMVKKELNADQNYLAEDITSQVADTYVVESSRLRSTLADRFSSIASALSFSALIITLVVVPQVALVSSMVSNERRGEFGLFRALGATKRFVFGSVFTETLLLAAIGGLVGLAGTCLTLMIIQTQLGSEFLGPFVWPSAAALAVSMFTALAAALAVGGLSAIYPAYASSRQEPYETIRKGGGR